MTWTPPNPDTPEAESKSRRLWPRGFNGYALIIAVVFHLLILVAVLSWRAKAPPPKKPRSTDVSVVLQKDPPKPEPLMPPPKMPDLQPPNLPAIPELPVIEVSKVEAAPQAPPPPPPPPTVAPAPPPPVAPPVAPPPAPAASSAKVFEECEEGSDRKMVADVFRLRPGFKTVRDMRRGNKPIKTVCLAQLDVTPRKFNDGFPGLDLVEWFGLDIRFTVNIPEDGTWELMLLSDDGAILTVDGVEVINNDGIHAPEPAMATVKMAKGPRDFRVRYFQGPAPDLALMLAWRKPGVADFQYIPRRLLGRPAATASPTP